MDNVLKINRSWLLSILLLLAGFSAQAQFSANFSWSPNPGCPGAPVQFSGTVSNGAPTPNSWQWTFPGGSPATSSQQNPSCTWSSSGAKNVTLKAIYSTFTLTKTLAVTIGELPNADFGWSVAQNTLSFTNSSQNAVSYGWAFGDGGSSAATNPVHAYAAAGDYTVTLTATNGCGSVSKSKAVTTAPTADFDADVTTVCFGSTVQFTNLSSSNATSFLWQFPGGTPASASSKNPPAVTYNTPGLYTVTLTASNTAGTTTLTKTGFVRIQGMPQAAFAYQADSMMLLFDGLASQGADSYAWDFGDGATGDGPSPAHEYETPGFYPVMLTITNTCGSDSQQGTVSTAPMADFETADTSVCPGSPVQFVNLSSDNAVSFQWEFEGGLPAIVQGKTPPPVSFANPGYHSVTLRAINAAGTTAFTRSQYIHVRPDPVAGFTFTVNGAAVAFNSDASQFATDLLWDFGDGTSFQGLNPTHTYAADGIYTVLLTAINSCGTNHIQSTLEIATPPAANFSAPDITGCGPIAVTFTDASSPNAGSWSWSFPGATPDTSTQQNPVVAYAEAGTYTAVLTVTNNTGSSTLTKQFNVTLLPEAFADFSITVNGAVVACTALPTTVGDTLVWDFGDSTDLATGQTVTHQYAQDGTYTIWLITYTACGMARQEYQVTIATTASYEAGKDSSFTLYPNPARGEAFIRGNFEQNARIELYDAVGRKCRDLLLSEYGEQTIPIEAHLLTPGVYNICITSAEKKTALRLVVAR